MTERRYTMTRVRAGDYLLPSNDARTLWRVYTYTEDDGRTYWALSRMPFPRGAIDLEDWSGWEHWASPLASRADAIDQALRVDDSALDRR